MEMNYLSSVKHAGETTDMDAAWVNRSQILQQHNSIVYCIVCFCNKGKSEWSVYTIFLLTAEQLELRVRSRTCEYLLDAWNIPRVFNSQQHFQEHYEVLHCQLSTFQLQ